MQGGRLRGCSPAGGAHKEGWGGNARRRALKTQGRFPAGGPGRRASARSPASRRAPAHLETPPARDPAHWTRTCCARAPVRRPERSPSPGPASPLSAHLLRSPPSWDAAHLSFVRGGTIRSGQLSFRERPLCARRRAKRLKVRFPLDQPHFRDEETEVLSGGATCSRSHTLRM